MKQPEPSDVELATFAADAWRLVKRRRVIKAGPVTDFAAGWLKGVFVVIATGASAQNIAAEVVPYCHGLVLPDPPALDSEE